MTARPAGGGGGTTTNNILAPALFSMPGTVTTQASPPFRATGNLTISGIYLNLLGAPVGSSLVVVVKKNGSTISTLTRTAGSTAEVSDTPGTTLVSGDLLTVVATSVGSTTPATDAVVQVNFA